MYLAVLQSHRKHPDINLYAGGISTYSTALHSATLGPQSTESAISLTEQTRLQTAGTTSAKRTSSLFQ